MTINASRAAAHQSGGASMGVETFVAAAGALSLPPCVCNLRAVRAPVLYGRGALLKDQRERTVASDRERDACESLSCANDRSTESLSHPFNVTAAHRSPSACLAPSARAGRTAALLPLLARPASGRSRAAAGSVRAVPRSHRGGSFASQVPPCRRYMHAGFPALTGRAFLFRRHAHVELGMSSRVRVASIH